MGVQRYTDDVPGSYEIGPAERGYIKIEAAHLEHNECLRQSFMDLMEAIYITGDVDQMEINLGYLCDELGFVIPSGAPLVEKIISNDNDN